MYSIDNHINLLQENLQKEIAKKVKFTEDYILLLNKAKPIISNMEKSLNKLGFTIISNNIRRTGIEGDGNTLHCGYSILPKSPTFKYVKDEGYNKHGRGKNHSKLVKKSTDLQQKILDLTGVECSVNQYSFGIKRGETKGGNILIEFWIE